MSGRGVAVVDSNEWVRRGLSATLRETDGVRVSVSLHPAAVLAGEASWDQVDVALVNARGDPASFDRFLGIAAAAVIRMERDPSDTAIVVFTSEDPGKLLLARLSEAGVQFHVRSDAVKDAGRLLDLVRSPTRARRVVRPSRATLLEHGFYREPCFNAAMHYIEQAGLTEAFIPGTRQRDIPISRRQIIRTRRDLTELLCLSPAPHLRRQGELPAWRQLTDLINRARGADLALE